MFSDPNLLSQNEISLVVKRRKEESNFFKGAIKFNSQEGIKLFALDIDWFLVWKGFVTNEVSGKNVPNSKKIVSSNKLIGVLPPGPVTNANLFEKKAKSFGKETLKPEMKKNQDYVIVNEKVWRFFLFNYNGGPEIEVRKSDDIYTNFIGCSQLEYSTYSSLKETIYPNDFSFDDAEEDQVQSDNFLLKEAHGNQKKFSSSVENDFRLLHGSKDLTQRFDKEGRTIRKINTINMFDLNYKEETGHQREPVVSSSENEDNSEGKIKVVYDR